MNLIERHRWALFLAGVVVVTTIIGLVRLSGDAEPARTTSLTSSVAVGDDGSVDVVQRITFTPPRSRLTVSIPVRRAPVRQFDPRIDALSVRVDGTVVPGPTTPMRVGETRTLTFAEPATSVVLSYSAVGAIASTQPSASGRALALLTPLTIDEPASLRSRLEIGDDGVLNLGCTTVDESSIACGSDAGGRWEVVRGPDDAVVDIVAQVNLLEAPTP